MYIVSALYHFVLLEDFEALKKPLLTFMLENGIFGTFLLAKEGINGTVSGKPEAIDNLMAYLKQDIRFKNLQTKESFHSKIPFERPKVKLKREIVTMGVEDLNPTENAGQYVKPKEWNAFVSDPNVCVVDTRNDYEVSIGTFPNAINPETTTFREFPQFVAEHLTPLKNDGKTKIAMYCTGGIRCEKSTAYLKQQGFKEVYHLEGGILKYLEEIPEAESFWKGECFVFDNRVAVNHGLEKGQYDQCYACRMPITETDKEKESYIKGQSCHHCCDNKESSQKIRYAERQKQINLAAEKGQKHIGGLMPAIIQYNKAVKRAKKEKGEI